MEKDSEIMEQKEMDKILGKAEVLDRKSVV